MLKPVNTTGPPIKYRDYLTEQRVKSKVKKLKLEELLKIDRKLKMKLKEATTRGISIDIEVDDGNIESIETKKKLIQI